MSAPEASATPHGPARWERGGKRVITSTRIFEVQAVEFRHPAREQGREFFIIESSDWVNVLALTPARELVLVRQFRFGSDRVSLEIPGGIIDGDEGPLAAGLRELREETGYEGRGARVLATVHPNPAIQSNRCHFVLVEDCVRTSGLEWDPDEELTVEVQPLAAVYEAVRRGEITHALVLDALLHLGLSVGFPALPAAGATVSATGTTSAATAVSAPASASAGGAGGV